jgi:tetratricopeptide (TPR) repeat protein
MPAPTTNQLPISPASATVSPRSDASAQTWSPNTWSKGARAWASAALVVVATVAVYYPVASFEFLNYDDPANITENSFYRPFTWRNVRQLWLRPYSGVYVPVTSMFWAGEVALARAVFPMPEAAAPVASESPGAASLAPNAKPNAPAPPLDTSKLLDARVFHVGNLALHLLSALCVLVLLRRLTGSDLGALAGALLFAIHPVQVESVCWITETKGLLCAVFAWLAIIEYLRYTELASTVGAEPLRPAKRPPAPARSRRPAYLHLAAATLCFVLSLLSKPMAVSVPLMAAVVALVWYRPSWRELAPLGVWLLLGVGLAMLTKRQQPSESFAFVAPRLARPLIAGDTLAFYLSKLVWPLHLTTDYGRSPYWLLQRPALFYTTWLAPAAVLIVMLLCRAPRALWAAVGLFLVALAPLLGLVPFGFQDNSTVADRYLYLAMLGPALAAAWLVKRCATRGDTWRRAAAATIAIVALVLGVLAHRQCLTWRDSEHLAKAGLTINPTSPLLRQILAVELTRRGEQDAAMEQYLQAAATDRLARGQLLLGMAYARREEWPQAIACFRRGIELQPGAAACHHVLAEAMHQNGEDDAAMEHYRTARRLDPYSNPVHMSLAHALGRANRWDEAIPEIRAALALQTEDGNNWSTLAQALGRTGKAEEAVAAYREALRLSPESAAAHVNLGTALWQANHLDEALAIYSRALELDPANAETLKNIGLIHIGQGRLDEAARSIERWLAGDPENADALYNLGEIRNRQQRDAEAYDLLRRAVSKKPELAEAQSALASLCDRLGRAPEAIEHYQAALKLQPQNSVLHNNLGVLLFKSGDAAGAVEHLARAVEINPAYTEAKNNLEAVRRAGAKP